jgi:hypothetical protein
LWVVVFDVFIRENVKDDNPQEKTDVIEFAGKYLVEHPEACKLNSAPRGGESNPKGAGAPHKHGNAPCIVAFLGDKNWPERTVQRYMCDSNGY